MQRLTAYFQAKFSGTIAIPTNSSSNESSNNSEVVVANIADKRSQFEATEPSTAHIVDSEEIELCHSERKLIYPKTAMTKDSQWVTIAHLAEHKQGVLVELCVEVDQKCKFDDAFPLGLTSSCVQRYNFRPMVVLVNGESKEELVKLPSHCKCVLKPRRKNN